jgi:hypothetical protein
LTIIATSLVVILGGWLWIQREVNISPQGVLVTRWIDRLRSRPGRWIPAEGTECLITLDNIRTLYVVHQGTKVLGVTLAYWEPSEIRELIDGIRASGIPLWHYWHGEYPPDIG